MEPEIGLQPGGKADTAKLEPPADASPLQARVPLYDLEPEIGLQPEIGINNTGTEGGMLKPVPFGGACVSIEPDALPRAPPSSSAANVASRSMTAAVAAALESSGAPEQNEEDDTIDTRDENSLCSSWSHLTWAFAPPADEVVGGAQLEILEKMRKVLDNTKMIWGKCSWLLSVALATLFLCTPVFIFVVQASLLTLVMEAGTSTVCKPATQQGCHKGQYCSITYAMGQCNDCRITLLLGTPDIIESCAAAGWRYDYTVSSPLVMNNQSFPGGCRMLAHCMGVELGTSAAAATASRRSANRDEGFDGDLDSKRCDYLVLAQQSMKLQHLIILIIGSILATVPIMRDMDESDTELGAFLLQVGLLNGISFCKSRGRASDRLARRGVSEAAFDARAVRFTEAMWYVGFHMIAMLRKNMMPSLVASTTVIILTASEGESSFKAVDIFLNVVAVGFICEIDNLYGQMCLNPQVKPHHERLLERLKDSEQRQLRLPVRWLQNRLHSFVLSAFILCECLYMTDVILSLNSVFGWEVLQLFDNKGSWSATLAYERLINAIGVADDANCNKVMLAVQTMTLFRALLGCAIAFAFDVLTSCVEHKGMQKLRRLAEHALAFGSNMLINYVSYYTMVKAAKKIHQAPRVFSCGWDGCEQQL